MENFVTFEIAQKLKEKGFRKKCVWHTLQQVLKVLTGDYLGFNELSYGKNND